MKFKFLTLFLALALATGLSAAEYGKFDSLAAQAAADLQKALAELAEAQKQIAEEKIPLAAKLNQMEEDIARKRRDLERAQRAQDNKLVELNALKAELKKRGDEQQYLVSLLNEYARLFETRVHITEVQAYQPAVEKAKAAVENADLTAVEKLERQTALLRTSLERLKNLEGGHIFAASALSPAGLMQKGKVALAGPVALFVDDAGAVAGLAELQLGSPEPSVIEVGAEFLPGIKQVVAGQPGEIPLDGSQGNALKLSAIKETWGEHILKGGPVMAPILLLGLICLLICAYKIFQIRRIRVATPKDLQGILECLRQEDRDGSLAIAGLFNGPIGDLLITAVNHAREKKEYLEEVLYEKMLLTKPRIERLLPFIALAAAAAPLLGLLGTVTGMINTFNLITVYGTGDPKTLASGISEALITTEFGLIVAIPALLIHAFLSRKVKGVLGTMEQLTVGFINGVPEANNNPHEK